MHSTVKERWQQRDPTLIEGMQLLGTLADSAVEALKTGDVNSLGTLMKKNFATRRALYGDGPVGALNIAMVELAERLGLAAKFTGSGGALVCIRADGKGW